MVCERNMKVETPRLVPTKSWANGVKEDHSKEGGFVND
jgi:hypothetical protein